MALLVRIVLLPLALALAPATGAGAALLPASAPASLPMLANPAWPPGSVLKPSPRPKREALTLGERAVRIATAELGVPYRYGGSTPSGFDCSGLVLYVYGRLGVDLPHNAAAQYAYGRPVDRGDLRPGDLVFFHSLGHVGLYIGRGRFIHAPQSGERVEIQSLEVRSDLVEGARRITD